MTYLGIGPFMVLNLKTEAADVFASTNPSTVISDIRRSRQLSQYHVRAFIPFYLERWVPMIARSQVRRNLPVSTVPPANPRPSLQVATCHLQTYSPSPITISQSRRPRLPSRICPRSGQTRYLRCRCQRLRHRRPGLREALRHETARHTNHTVKDWSHRHPCLPSLCGSERRCTNTGRQSEIRSTESQIDSGGSGDN
jgi:hypothetical protein